MNQPNPFDFSDFGPAKRPSGPTGPGTPPPGAPAQPGYSGGFDPWAGQPPTRPQTGQDAFGQPTGTDAFGQTATSAGSLAAAGPPLHWFAVALALAVAGVALAAIGSLTGGNIATALAGWLLAGPIAIGALAVYNRADTRRRTEAIYSTPTWTSTLYWAVLVVCLAGIAVGAWQIALWAGRQ
jgi:hypothetical protein